MNTQKLMEIVKQADKHSYALALVPADTLKKFVELIGLVKTRMRSKPSIWTPYNKQLLTF